MGRARKRPYTDVILNEDEYKRLATHAVRRMIEGKMVCVRVARLPATKLRRVEKYKAKIKALNKKIIEVEGGRRNGD